MSDFNKKVLYQIGHYGFLINAFLHKLIYHKNDTAVFILDKVIMSKSALEFIETNKSNFKEYGEIFLYNDRDLINEFKTIEDMEKGIPQYFDNFLSSNNIDLNSFNEIYSSFDTFNAFGVYLTQKNIYFNMVEINTLHCQSHNRYPAHDLSKPYGATQLKYLALSADNKCVKKLFCCENAKLKDKPYEENINAPAMLKRVSNDEILNLISCYNLQFDTTQKYVCFMPASAWIVVCYFKIHRLNYMLLNSILVDLFMDENYKLMVKPHPNSDFLNESWQKYFNNPEIIPGYFPSSLMTYVPNLHIAKTLCTSLTGNDKNDPTLINAPFDCLYMYKSIYKLMFAYQLVKSLNLDNSQIYHYGFYDSVANSMINKFFKENLESKVFDFKQTENSIIVFDDPMWQKANKKDALITSLKNVDNNSIFIFINSKDNIEFIKTNDELSKNIITLTISKIKTASYSLEKTNDEELLIFCINDALKNKIKEFRSSRSFIRTGVDVSIKFKGEK